MTGELVPHAVTAIAAPVSLRAARAEGDVKGLPRSKIPSPIVVDRDLAHLYRRAWQVAWARLRHPQSGSGLVSDYVAPGLNGNLLQWHLCFITQYARYAFRAFPAPGMLSNMYAQQQPNGFIAREVAPAAVAGESGDALNPPLYAWAEWDAYRLTGDRARLARVLPALTRFHRWIVLNRRGSQGLYFFGDAKGSGMDDQPRAGAGWIDLSCQMALDAHHLGLIARELGRDDEAAAFDAEHAQLAETINRLLWNNERRWYEDLGGADFKSVASFWALLAGVATDERAAALIEHLTNPSEFWRPTPAPTVSADSSIYNPPDGERWRGAVWSPTNYMIVRGLLAIGRPGLARNIALEHLRAMAAQLRNQDALFASCSPERDRDAEGDMASWAGLGPIAMLIEAVLGLRADAPTNTLTWAPRLGSRHGITNLHFGDTAASVVCAARTSRQDYVISTEANRPFTLAVVTNFIAGAARRGKRSLGPLESGIARIEVRAGKAQYRIGGEMRPDGAPPARPRNLAATRSAGGVSLRWHPCSDEDLAGYEVYRTEDHGWRKISSSLAIWSAYVDANPPPGERAYAVAAVDLAGNTSAMSLPARVTEAAPAAQT